MRHNLIDTIIFWLVLALVGTVLWILVLAAAIHLVGCSVTIESGEIDALHDRGVTTRGDPSPSPTAGGI